MANCEGFNLEKNEADFAQEIEVEEKRDEPQEKVEDVSMLGMVMDEENVKSITENPEFLLNPNKMSNQGKAVFYTNLVVGVLLVVAALVGKKFNAAVVLLALNVVVMAYLHSNVINCMVVGNCNVYSTILTILNVLGQVLVISALVYLIVMGKKA